MRDCAQVPMSGTNATLAHQQPFGAIDALEAFWEFVSRQGYDAARIRAVSALVFINMAPLYAGPVAHYLYCIGRYQLQQVLGGR